MNVAYVRVSTIEQNEDRQMAALQDHNIDKWFVEKTSGKDTKGSNEDIFPAPQFAVLKSSKPKTKKKK